MTNADSTPGVWQDGRWVIVLSKVTHCEWRSGGSIAGILNQATHVDIYLGNKRVELYVNNYDESKRMSESFLRALNLYWETRA